MMEAISDQDAQQYVACHTASGVLRILFDDDKQPVSGALGILCLKGQPPFNCLLTVSPNKSLNRPKQLKINNLQQPAGSAPFILDTECDVKKWVCEDLKESNGSCIVIALKKEIAKKLEDVGYEFLSTSATWPHKTVNLIVQRGKNDYQLERMPVINTIKETWFVEYSCDSKVNPALSGMPLFDDDICISTLHVGGQQSRAAFGIQLFTERLGKQIRDDKNTEGEYENESYVEEAATDKAKSIFISYSWSHRADEVRQFADKLKSQGLHVWIDTSTNDKSGVKTDLEDDIVQGIDDADLVLAFVSEPYSQSGNCLDEYLYAQHMQKVILAINLDFEYNDSTTNKPRGGLLVFRTLRKARVNVRKGKKLSEVFQEVMGRITAIFQPNSNEPKEETLLQISQEAQDSNNNNKKKVTCTVM